MSRYALSLPQQLKQKAEDIARQQGVSLNQFILWAVAEKVGSLAEGLSAPNFPAIGYRRGATGYGLFKILELVPNQRLALMDDDNPEAESHNVLTWTLEGGQGRTRLTLVHSGFAPDTDNSGIDTGWLKFMKSIKV